MDYGSDWKLELIYLSGRAKKNSFYLTFKLTAPPAREMFVDIYLPSAISAALASLTLKQLPLLLLALR